MSVLAGMTSPLSIEDNDQVFVEERKELGN